LLGQWIFPAAAAAYLQLGGSWVSDYPRQDFADSGRINEESLLHLICCIWFNYFLGIAKKFCA
jgi:hypothetical protein